jgi:hypothetical protein
MCRLFIEINYLWNAAQGDIRICVIVYTIAIQAQSFPPRTQRKENPYQQGIWAAPPNYGTIETNFSASAFIGLARLLNAPVPYYGTRAENSFEYSHIG